ncbi:velvet factor-domain-containing protein [Geopyxis carbonaria]|nr:velvet factor-domain-containing protein [Geopyxis carbonaria]
MCTNLYSSVHDSPSPIPPHQALAGTLVSSLHRLKDIDNSDGGFFVFGDLSVKIEGEFRLRFSLFEMLKNEVVHIKSITSEPFTVYAAKNFPGMSESTFLSRSFGDQGVRLRIRKEPRTLLKRPPPRPEEYPPRSYIPMNPEPRTVGYPPPPPAGGFLPSPGHEYQPSYSEGGKRQRTDSLVSPRQTVDSRPAEPQYVPRPGSGYEQSQAPYQMYPPSSQPQYQPYGNYPPPPPSSISYAPPASGPHPGPEYGTYTQRAPPQNQGRPPHPSSASSPYQSPRLQPYSRSPLPPASQLPNQYRYSSQSQQPQPSHRNTPPSQQSQSTPRIRSPITSAGSLPSLPPTSSIPPRGPTHPSPHTPSPLSVSGPPVSASLSSMPPPPPLSDHRQQGQSQQPPNAVFLPPLQLPPMTSGTQNSPPAGQHNTMPPMPPMLTKYGPPTSFDSAAQQQSSSA